MKTHEKIMKSYIYTGLASLAVIFCVTVLADDPDRRKPTNRSRGGDERRTDQRSQSKSSQSRGSQPRSSQQRSSQSKGKAQNRGGDNNDRRDMDMDAMRKRIEAGVKSGRIKREDAGKMLEGLRKRMEAAKRGGDDKKEEGKQDPRLARYRTTEREIAAAVKAGKLSKEDAQKKLIAVRKQLWSSDISRSSQPRDSSRSRSASSPSRSSQSKDSQSRGSQSRSSQQRSSQSKGRDQNRGDDNSNWRDMVMDAMRKRIEEGVKSGKIKREDAHKMLEGLRKRMEMAKRGGDDKKRKGENDPRKAGNRGPSDDRVRHLKEAIEHLKAAGRPDLAEEVEKRAHDAHRGDRDERSDRGEAMRKAWEERIKQWRELRERANNNDRRSPQSRGSSRSRTPERSSGTDWRKAIEERMKQAREARERRGGESDRGRGRPDFSRGGPGRGGPGGGPGASRGGPQRRGLGGPPQGRRGPGRR